MPPRVAFHTLGCKLNQLETESIADAFVRAGAEVLPFDEEGLSSADLLVVNTCTVTIKAERSARRIVRLALAADPSSLVLVTGCYAQVEADALAAIGERVLVLPGASKAALLSLPARLASSGEAEGRAGFAALLREWIASEISAAQGSLSSDASGSDGRFEYNPGNFAYHTRPALKVQDGCDKRCAYCRVPMARGASASLPAIEVLARARALEEAGRSEIVLTGVNLSSYRDGDLDFPGLLRLLVAGTDRIAFRLSSYEPEKVDSAFLEAFAHSRLRPHVHLAVQSGSNRILNAMGRGYGPTEVLAAVENIRRVKGEPFIAADIIAGFPGETEADFDDTLDLVRRCGFAWIHAFRYSPRPGTRAASMSGRVLEREAGERAEALLELGKAGKAGYIDRFIGKELSGILELGLGATSENYLKLKLIGLPGSARPGQEIRCRLKGRHDAADAFAVYISTLLGIVP